jgi:hypothetical protein
MLHSLAPAFLTLLAAAGTPVELGGLKSDAPTAWKETPSTSPMRLKQFTVPGKGSDGDAELVIFFFGAGQGGDTTANIDRWKKQFTPPAGKTLDEVSKVSPVKVAAKDAKATLVDVSGTYMFKAAPMSPGPGEPRPNSRMLAVVLETAKGNYYLKLTGPAKTVDAARKPFETWVKAFK